MPSRKRSGNLIKRKMHHRVVKTVENVFLIRPSKRTNKYISIRDFISDVYGSTRNEEDRQMLRAYYYACKDGTFSPPAAGDFVITTDGYKYVTSIK